MLPIEESDPEFANLLKWYYESGLKCDFKKIELPGRNEECFCGSGKKFKKCCINLEELKGL